MSICIGVAAGAGCSSSPENPFERCWVKVENRTHRNLELFYFPGEDVTGGSPDSITPPLRRGFVEVGDSRVWRERCALGVVSVIAVAGQPFDVSPEAGVASSARLLVGDTARITFR